MSDRPTSTELSRCSDGCSNAVPPAAKNSPWGTAFFNDDFPFKYDANMILADRPLGDVTVEEVSATVDRLYDGMRHREIEVADEADAERLAFGLAEQGYVIDRLVVMAHRREPDREPDLDAAEPPTRRGPRVPARGHHAANHGARSQASPSRSSATPNHSCARSTGTLFTQRVDGRMAGSCELYVHGDVAQVESVNTLEEFRGRGVARNVVLRAVHEAKAAGATLVFLFADQDDWPQHLYRRMGFDPMGRSRVYMRVPENERPSHGEIPGG